MVFDSYADAVEYLVFHGDGQSRIEPFKDGEVSKYRIAKRKRFTRIGNPAEWMASDKGYEEEEAERRKNGDEAWEKRHEGNNRAD